MLAFDNKLKYALAFLLLATAGLALLGLAGRDAPTLQALQLPSLDGERIHIPDQRGRLTWVSFWSASCAICLHELPMLDALHREYGQQVQIVAVAMPYDPPNASKEVQTRLQPTLPVLLDLDATAARQLTPDMTVPPFGLKFLNLKVRWSAGHAAPRHIPTLTTNDAETYSPDFRPLPRRWLTIMGAPCPALWASDAC